jgi:Relaxase/Mobilisation nuclease domain.
VIVKKIDKKPDVRDDYSHLGRYVAAAREKGEKLDKFWIVKCDAGAGLDDLDTALIEIEATRAMKPGIDDKTYHLVVSFHLGEQDKLSLEDLQDIERHFAEALGFAEHQRVAGTHINTDNFHMHVAFNKVHPFTHKVHTPHRDYATLSKVARAMEKKYGLQVDKGMEARNPVSAKARTYEARTWQQSFERHLQEHKSEILVAIAGAGDWRQVHEGLAEYDTVLRKRGAGMVFAQIGGKAAMKASALGRDCSLAALEKRLGPFQPAPERKPEDQAKAAPRRPYLARPLTRHPGVDRLWRTYRQEKRSTFLGRHVFNLRSWKDYLLADAHKDALALAIIVTYKELLHTVEEALTPRRAPYRPPKSLRPALETWYAATPWKPPAIAGIGKGDVDAMDLKTDDSGQVLFPFRDRDGHVWAVRALDAQGRTCDVGDPAGRPDLAHVIDPAGHLGAGKSYAGPILLTTDCLAAAAIHLETETPVVIVGKEADLPTRARALRAQYPDSAITIAATEKSRPVIQAAAAAGGELVTISGNQVLTKWIADQVDKGKAVPVERTLADTMGAFVEDALSPEDALASAPRKGKAPGKGPGMGR